MPRCFFRAPCDPGSTRVQKEPTFTNPLSTVVYTDLAVRAYIILSNLTLSKFIILITFSRKQTIMLSVLLSESDITASAMIFTLYFLFRDASTVALTHSEASNPTIYNSFNLFLVSISSKLVFLKESLFASIFETILRSFSY